MSKQINDLLEEIKGLSDFEVMVLLEKMKGTEIELDDKEKELMETLADIEHERWASWQKSVHDRGERTEDGKIIIPADLVERWDRQISTPYSELTEEEKQKDRDQVMKYWDVLMKYKKGE